jgi:cell division transport system permease protein
MRFRTVAGEAWRSLAANASTTLAATMTVLIAMFILGLFMLAFSWAHDYSNNLKKQLVVKVFFCTELSCGRDATKADENRIGNLISSLPEVKPGGVRFVPKSEALKIMQRRNPELTSQLPGNPLPDAFEITPNRGEDVSKIAAALPQGRAGIAAGVEKIDYGKKTAERVLTVAHWFEAIFVIAAALLLTASALLIGNTIRLSIFSRRREIEVMKLVGATNWFVRGPFMLEGLICGLAGSFLAVVFLFVGKETAWAAIHIKGSSSAHAWSLPLVALMLMLFGLVLGGAGSGITIRRFLKV